MQNEQTLIDLGFQKMPSGEYLFRGKHQKFIAQVTTCNGPVYVELYLISPEIDNRPYSNRKGCHFQHKIKDCCSHGSVERAIKKYDLPSQDMTMSFTGIHVLHEANHSHLQNQSHENRNHSIKK